MKQAATKYSNSGTEYLRDLQTSYFCPPLPYRISRYHFGVGGDKGYQYLQGGMLLTFLAAQVFQCVDLCSHHNSMFHIPILATNPSSNPQSKEGLHYLETQNIKYFCVPPIITHANFISRMVKMKQRLLSTHKHRKFDIFFFLSTHSY